MQAEEGASSHGFQVIMHVRTTLHIQYIIETDIIFLTKWMLIVLEFTYESIGYFFGNCISMCMKLLYLIRVFDRKHFK